MIYLLCTQKVVLYSQKIWRGFNFSGDCLLTAKYNSVYYGDSVLNYHILKSHQCASMAIWLGLNCQV